MTAFLIYIIRWAVALTLLYSLYGLILRRETFHTVNRTVLLIILMASMILPFCRIETSRETVLSSGMRQVETFVREDQGAIVWASAPKAPPIVGTLPRPEKKATSVVWLRVMALAYFGGLVFYWLRYLGALFIVIRTIVGSKRGQRVAIQGATVIIKPGLATPCSWMRWIFLSPEDAKNPTVLAHELAHVRLHHSWDMLLSEATCCTLWFLPLSWLLRKDLKDIHEYQADQRVVHQGFDEYEYQLMLINKAATVGLQPVVNALNQSSIKKRLSMMYKKPSRRWLALKAVYLLPLAILALTAFARPTVVSDIQARLETEEQKASLLSLPAVIHRETADAGPETSADIKNPEEPAPDLTPEADAADDAWRVFTVAPVTPDELSRMNGDFRIRREKDYTLLYIYLNGTEYCGDEAYREKFTVKYDMWPSLLDPDTGNRYLARGIYGTDRKEVKPAGYMFPNQVYQIVFVYAPLPFSTRRVAVEKTAGNYTAAFYMEDVEMKPETLARPLQKDETYDERPANQAPTVVRAAASAYDVNNEDTYAVYTDLQSYTEAERGEYVFMGRNHGIVHSSLYSLYRCKDATYLAFDTWVRDKALFRFNTGTMIIDVDTGREYPLRRVEHFPTDQCFWVKGNQPEGSEQVDRVRFILEFPPLDSCVSRIAIYHAMGIPHDGILSHEGIRSVDFAVSGIRPGHPEQNVDTTKRGEIIQ